MHRSFSKPRSRTQASSSLAAIATTTTITTITTTQAHQHQRINMVAYTSFALVGAGALGSHVASELLKKKISLKILTRDDSKVRVCVSMRLSVRSVLLRAHSSIARYLS